jgi:hypothetical protein
MYNSQRSAESILWYSVLVSVSSFSQSQKSVRYESDGLFAVHQFLKMGLAVENQLIDAADPPHSLALAHHLNPSSQVRQLIRL